MPLSRIILIISGILLALSGTALVFLPLEIVAVLGSAGGAGVPVLAQLFGSALIAIGFINWNSRANLMGGIYGRPLALGNFFFFAVSAISVAKERSHLPPFALVIILGLGLFAIAFGWILFFADPIKKGKATIEMF